MCNILSHDPEFFDRIRRLNPSATPTICHKMKVYLTFTGLPWMKKGRGTHCNGVCFTIKGGLT